MSTLQTRTKAEYVTGTPPEAMPPAEGIGRLVVIVPDVTEAALLASRIQVMARARSQEVLLIGVALQPLTADELRRRLTLLAAFLQNAGTRVQVRVLEASEWTAEIKALLQEGDLLACCVIETQPGTIEHWTELLSKRFQRPVYAFMDGGLPSMPQRGLPARAAPWLSSIAIILGFFWLQVLLSQQVKGAGSTGLLIATVPVEVGLIWLCNALLG